MLAFLNPPPLHNKGKASFQDPSQTLATKINGLHQNNPSKVHYKSELSTCPRGGVGELPELIQELQLIQDHKQEFFSKKTLMKHLAKTLAVKRLQVEECHKICYHRLEVSMEMTMH